MFLFEDLEPDIYPMLLRSGGFYQESITSHSRMYIIHIAYMIRSPVEEDYAGGILNWQMGYDFEFSLLILTDIASYTWGGCMLKIR